MFDFLDFFFGYVLMSSFVLLFFSAVRMYDRRCRTTKKKDEEK